MRNLLHCRRGAAAFATVVALAPMIGVVALGGEAATWYVTKQYAQNAADAAAYSGALFLACAVSSGSTTICPLDSQSLAYRGKEFAAQNGFCNSGDTSYPGSACAASLPKGTSQSVAIAALTTWKGTSGNFVKATVQQTQPAYFAALLGFSTINIGATAVAVVNSLPAAPCALALTGSISFQGSPNINAPNCGMASNDPASNALNFTGAGTTMNLASLSAAGGCTGSANFCKNALTYRPPVTNPFAALDAVSMPTLSACAGNSLTAYSAATPCMNKNVTLSGNTTLNLTGGVYFISGTLTLKGSTSVNGTALFIILPSASFSMKGSGTINLTANASLTASQLPAALQPDASLLAEMALYDQSSTAIQIGGNSSINFAGNMYAPNTSVTFQGNPTIDLGGNKGCGQLVAQSIAFNGNATFDDSGCPLATKPTAQYVSLVQ